MPYNTTTKQFTAGKLGVPDLNQAKADTLAAALAPVVNGAATARLLAARFADAINLADYILPIDADGTNGFNRAIAQAQALGRPIRIDVPAGTYTISAAISPMLLGAQAIDLRGAGSAVTMIRQVADADGIAAVLQNYGAFGLGGAFNVSGLTFVMAASGSTSRTALSVSTTGVSGNTGCPLVLDDIVVSSPTPGSYWARGIKATAFADLAYLSRISVYQPAQSVGITVTGNSQSYTTSFFIDGAWIAGGTGLVLGDYLQGIHVDNLNTVNTIWAVRSEPTLAGADTEYCFTRCYLYGKSIFHALEGAVAHFQVRFASCYFDGNVNGPGAAIDRHVQFLNVPQVTITGSVFNGASPAAANPIIGLYFSNQSYDTLVSGCTFGGYGSPGDGSASVAMYCDAATTNISVLSNVFDYNAKAVTNLGTGNVFADTAIRRCEAGNDGFYLSGLPGVPSAGPARIVGVAEVRGAYAAGTTTASNFPNTGLSVGWNLTGGGGEVDLFLGRQSGSGGLNIYSVGASGLLDSTSPIFALDRTGKVAATDIAIGGTDYLAGAWSSYAATISAGSGTLATATANVRYRKLGRTVLFDLTATVSSNGSGAGQINVSLPFANGTSPVMLASRDLYSTNAVSGYIGPSATSLAINLLSNGGYPVTGSSASFTFSGVYEASA